MQGGPWNATVLRRILMSGRISGQREHREEIVAPGDWPAVITPQDTARLRAILSDPSRRTNRATRRYLLSGGLLRCGLCGATLVSRPRGDGKRCYICAKGPVFAGCNRIKILADDLEDFVVEAVLYRLDTPELQAAVAGAASEDAEAAAVAQAIKQDQAQLEELATAYGNKAFTMPEWNAARQPIDSRIETAKRRMSRLNRSSALDGFVGNSEALRAQWADLSLNRQRAIIAAVVDHLTIKSAVRGRNTFDDSRIILTWRV